MPTAPLHINWLVNTGRKLKTADGKDVEIWEFQHKKDDSILSSWAAYFRQHYCDDAEIDLLRDGTGLSRSEYLKQLIFPDASLRPGPSIRSGDFAEILVADYLCYLLNYWVPRVRYDNKIIRNQSTPGSDILAFKFISDTEDPNDILAVFEAKATLTATVDGNRLQDAIDGSIQDFNIRKAEALNALKRRLIRDGKATDAKKIRRFQNEVDHPYRHISGAAVVLATTAFDDQIIAKATSATHPNNKDLHLIVIKGDTLMDLVHELYRRAADEA